MHRGRRVDTDDTLAQLCDGVAKQSGWRQKRLPFFAPCTCKVTIAKNCVNCRRASFVIWAGFGLVWFGFVWFGLVVFWKTSLVLLLLLTMRVGNTLAHHWQLCSPRGRLEGGATVGNCGPALARGISRITGIHNTPKHHSIQL